MPGVEPQRLSFNAPWECWVVWAYDNGPGVLAIYSTELEALRFGMSLGYIAYVKQIEPGEIMEQLNHDKPAPVE
jgi:hypothetical protein